MARILIIDDQPAVRTVVRKVLERHEHEVVEEGHGQTALDRLSGEPADVVITDVFMPEMDGIDFLLQVRDTCPGARVIVMSGGGLLAKNEVLADADALGADATLAKPFSAQDLVDTVGRVLAMPAGEPEGDGGAPGV